MATPVRSQISSSGKQFTLKWFGVIVLDATTNGFAVSNNPSSYIMALEQIKYQMQCNQLQKGSQRE